MALSDDLALVRGLRFANLTSPILRQMLDSERVWGSLLDIAQNAQRNSGRGAYWGPDAKAGSLELKLSSKYEVRMALKFWSAPNTMGPDQLRNRQLDISLARLPDTLMVACAGKRVGEIVDAARFHHAFTDERVKRAEAMQWGLALHLDMPCIQPTDEDVETMQRNHKPYR